MNEDNYPFVSVAIIGRNEAENLPACIQSIRAMEYPKDRLEIMYVDTDSKDGSPEIAGVLGVTVYEEHSKFPSPGRARNRGWREAKFEIVHFVDGDMTVDPQYLRQAVKQLGRDGVVCVIGRVQEKYAGHNSLVRMLEYPWKAREAGEVDAPGAGGTFIKAALKEINGYNAEILKGQETELGHRLRQIDYHIVLIDQTMGTHDYEVHNLIDLWGWYQTKGRSFAHTLRLTPSASIAAERRAGRRAIIQLVLALLCTIGLIVSGLWWGFVIALVGLAGYVIWRYWQPARLRRLRIAYFLCEYFFKPAIWAGMIQQILRGG